MQARAHTHTHTHTLSLSLSLFLSLSLSLSHIDHLYDLRVLVTELQAVTTIKLSGKWSLTSFSKT